MSKDKPKCCKGVYRDGGTWQRPSQCARAGTVQRQGKWYCKQHDPIATEKRRKVNYEKWSAKVDARLKGERDREACHAAILAAGLSPATLAADPECIKRVVEAASLCAAWLDRYEPLGGCSQSRTGREARDAARAALAAIGKEPA